jgi:O-antigen/teichoic acid export membrane protein
VAPTGIVARLTRGGASYAVATLVTRGIAFLLLPIYTRFLTPADYGLVSLSETVAVCIPMLGGLGLNAALQRLYFKDPSESGRASTVATVLRGALLWLLVFLSLALALGGTVIHLVAPRFSAPFYPYVAIALTTAAANQVTEYRQLLFQTQERSRVYAAIAVGGFVLSAGCVLTLVTRLHLGPLGVLLGKLMGSASVAVLSTSLLWKNLRGRWNGARMREALTIGVPLVPHMLIALILGSADVLVIQMYRSVAEVGLYSVAYTLGSSVTVVTSTLMLTWSPVFYDLARHEGRDRGPVAQTSLLLTTVLVGAATAGAALAAYVIPFLLQERYRACADIVPIVIAGYVFHWFFALFHLSLLQAGKSYLIAVTTVSAAAVNMGLNFLVIPRWGAMGAALATLVAYLAEALAMYVMAQRYFRIPYPIGRLLLAVGAFLAVVCSTEAPISLSFRRPLTAVLAMVTLGFLYVLGRTARRNA